MSETYSSAVWSSAPGCRTTYIASTGRPSALETRNFERLLSQKCGIHRGNTAMTRSMRANGTSVYTGGADAATKVNVSGALGPGYCTGGPPGCTEERQALGVLGAER